MKSFENKQFDILHKIAQTELQKIREKYIFGIDIDSFDENFNEIVIRGYSILNTSLLGISYWHSMRESDYALEELLFCVPDGEKESSVFANIKEAEDYLKKSKRKYLRNPYTHIITRQYHTYYNMSGFDSSNYFLQFKNLTKEITLKKTIIEEGIRT